MGAAVYVSELPELFITAAGAVHVIYESGGKRYERVFPIETYEAYLGEANALVAEWRASRAAA